MSLGSKPRIAIIGAGPSGLTLARLLHLSDIPFTLFEREATSATRWQGGTLDLHADTGLLAIREAELWPEFRKHARYEGEAFVIANKHGERFLNIQAKEIESQHTHITASANGEDSPECTNERKGVLEEQERPEIDRIRLREILLASLPNDAIKWGSTFCNVESLEPLLLRFSHGVESNFDLVVGADGAWSKVRPTVSSIKPFHTGLGGLDLSIREPARQCPEVASLIGTGSYFAFGDKKGIMAQKNGDGSILVYFWSEKEERWADACGASLQSIEQVQKALLEDHQDWAPEFRQVIKATSDVVSVRSLYMLPVGHRWEEKKGVTLIGDAAHLMTPFAGEGVNLAMSDASFLADAICSSFQGGATSLHKAVRAHEEAMFERAAKVAEITRLNMMDFYFPVGGTETGLKRFLQRAGAPGN